MRDVIKIVGTGISVRIPEKKKYFALTWDFILLSKLVVFITFIFIYLFTIFNIFKLGSPITIICTLHWSPVKTQVCLFLMQLTSNGVTSL